MAEHASHMLHVSTMSSKTMSHCFLKIFRSFFRAIGMSTTPPNEWHHKEFPKGSLMTLALWEQLLVDIYSNNEEAYQLMQTLKVSQIQHYKVPTFPEHEYIVAMVKMAYGDQLVKLDRYKSIPLAEQPTATHSHLPTSSGMSSSPAAISGSSTPVSDSSSTSPAK
jgi:hypothetical protein